MRPSRTRADTPTRGITAADIRTYVINLRRRPDRHKRLTLTFPRELRAIFTSDWDGQFDGRRLDRAGLEAAGYRVFPWRIESDNPWWSRRLKLGEIGCALSHLACWQDAAAASEPFTLILEDDAVLVPDFLHELVAGLRRIVRHTEFDLLYLGRYPLELDQPVMAGVVSPGYSHCTFGYLLTRRALDALLTVRLDQAIVPVDELLPSLYIDHPRLDLRARFPRQLTALAFDPPLVSQLPKHEAGSDTEDSGFLDD